MKPATMIPSPWLSWEGNIIGPENRSAIAWGQELEEGVERQGEEGLCGGKEVVYVFSVVVITPQHAFVGADQIVYVSSEWVSCT